MAYSSDLRKRVLAFIEAGGQKTQACRQFSIVRATLSDLEFFIFRTYAIVYKRAILSVYENPNPLKKEATVIFRLLIVSVGKFP